MQCSCLQTLQTCESFGVLDLLFMSNPRKLTVRCLPPLSISFSLPLSLSWRNTCYISSVSCHMVILASFSVIAFMLFSSLSPCTALQRVASGCVASWHVTRRVKPCGAVYCGPHDHVYPFPDRRRRCWRGPRRQRPEAACIATERSRACGYLSLHGHISLPPSLSLPLPLPLPLSFSPSLSLSFSVSFSLCVIYSYAGRNMCRERERCDVINLVKQT